jgi:hypothetical protein
MFHGDLKSRIAARIFCNTPSYVRRAMEFIRPLVEERLAKMEALDAPVCQLALFDILSSLIPCLWGAQNDMLMWLMSEAKGVEKSLEGLTRRMLLVNFASIHTTSLVGNITSSSVVGMCPNYLWRRRLRKYCTAFSKIRNILSLSGKRSKPRWQRKAGRKPEWTRCIRLTVSCARPNGLVV